MKKGLLIIALFAAIAGCKSNHDKLQPIADVVKKYYMAELPQISSIDTIYMFVDTITPSGINILQAGEYLEAKFNLEYNESYLSNIDTILFDFPTKESLSEYDEKKADEYFALAKKADSTTFLYYQVSPMVIYKKQNLEREMARNTLYFDKNFNLVPLSSFVKSVLRNPGTNKPYIEPYKEEMVLRLNRKPTRFLKYY